MSSERNLSPVPPILLTANGGTEGQLSLTTTLGLFVKQVISIQGITVPRLNVQVKYVINNTQILVGPVGQNLQTKTDVSAFTTADGAFVYAAAQPKSTLPSEERLYASYIQEPSNSWRVTPVDSFGNSFDPTNPLPVSIDSEIVIGEVEVVGPSGHLLDPNNDGSVKNVQLFNLPYDSITATYPTSIQEVYQSRTGGISGTVIQTATVNYTDATKNFILNVART